MSAEAQAIMARCRALRADPDYRKDAGGKVVPLVQDLAALVSILFSRLEELDDADAFRGGSEDAGAGGEEEEPESDGLQDCGGADSGGDSGDAPGVDGDAVVTSRADNLAVDEAELAEAELAEVEASLEAEMAEIAVEIAVAKAVASEAVEAVAAKAVAAEAPKKNAPIMPPRGRRQKRAARR